MAQGDPFTGMPWPGVISDALGAAPDPLVKTIRYVDPLVLDLDGDGLEITPLSAGVLFDANGDTIKTGTAWIGADDGILVWDRNGNRRIDSGQELFGDETLLANGSKAAHGFAALNELDQGSLVDGSTIGAHDGVFDAHDAAYADLRVWRDLDQDGLSQADELQSLAQAGVQGIQLASQSTHTVYGDAMLAQSGSFTRSDQSVAQAASFNLAQNSFVREFEAIALSDAARRLPRIGASGWVRDLQEAATLDPELIALVDRIQAAPTRADYTRGVADLLREWGNASAFDSASRQALAADWGLTLSDPRDAQEAAWMDTAIKASDADRDAYRATLGADDLARFDAMRERMIGGLEQLHAYEAFTGHRFLDFSQILGDATHYVPRTAVGGRVAVEVWVPFSAVIAESRNATLSSQTGYLRVTLPEPPAGMAHIATLWKRLVDNATDNLMPALRLSRYLDMIDLSIDAEGIAFDFSRMNAAVAAQGTDNAYEGAVLLLDLHRLHGETLDGMGWNGMEQVRALVQRTPAEAAVREAFETTGFTVAGASAATGTEGSDVYAGDDEANTFNAGAGNDLLDGQAGNDSLSGGDGDDTIFGGEGNDGLYGGLGNDTLDGGAGDDLLIGGQGNNAYLFGRGDGYDTIRTDDGTQGKFNVLRFKDGVAPGDVIAEQVYDGYFGYTGLELSIAGTTDKVFVSGYFYGNNPAFTGANPVQRIEFADGTTWDTAAVLAKVYAGTDGNDSLTGTVYADAIGGGAGDDSIAAGNGDDGLLGGEGADTLNGEAGNDTLDGGAGNDMLSGGTGNNTYLFGRGDGVDIILNVQDTTASKSSVLRFKEGVQPGDIQLKQVYSHFWGWAADLELRIAGTGDRITIGGGMREMATGISEYSTVQRIEFADGTSWDLNTAKALLFAGTAEADAINGTRFDDAIHGAGGADVLYGRDGNDSLEGGLGDDTLSGEAGNDMLDGGAGNDSLNGGTGSNVYLFGRGDGVDSIVNVQDASTDKLGVLRFKEGVQPGDIEFKQVYSSFWGWAADLQVRIAGTEDMITIGGGMREMATGIAEYSTVQRLEFADGTRWDLEAVKAALFAGTAEADVLNGTRFDDIIHGAAGADQLNGGAGNDTLDGGAGNDSLNGGLGNDSYLFGRDAGRDVISDVDSSAGHADLVSFGADVAPEQLWFRRQDNDQEVSLIGTNDSLRIGNWYLGDAYHVEQFRVGDGRMTLESQVQSLVQAMAAFAPPPLGETSLSPDLHSRLEPMLAASWG